MRFDTSTKTAEGAVFEDEKSLAVQLLIKVSGDVLSASEYLNTTLLIFNFCLLHFFIASKHHLSLKRLVILIDMKTS